MAYTNTDYGFWTNPKVRAAGRDAAFLYIAGNGFCNEYLTDGFISETDVQTVAFNSFNRSPRKAIDALLSAGLWDRVPGGYEVHDYLDYNKSKQEVKELQNKKAAAGSKGGKASAQARAQADDTAPAQARAQAKIKQYNCDSISNSKDTTTTPDSEIFKFGYVFQEITGIDPRWHADEVDAVEKIIKAGGTPDDYRNALLAMQEKDYTIGSMKSALNWTLKDLKARTNPKRRNNGGHKSLSPELDEILKDAPIFAEDL